MVVKSPFVAFYSAESEKRGFRFPHGVVVICRKKSATGFLLLGRGKASFSPSSRINELWYMSLIRAPMLGRDVNVQVIDLGAPNGRVADFSRHLSGRYDLTDYSSRDLKPARI